jgi:hypothetical protein
VGASPTRRFAELTAARQAQQLAQQAQAAADQRLLRAAQDRGARGDIAITGLHYLDAAQHFQEAAELVPAGHPDERGRLLTAEAEALRLHGYERGDNAAMVNAIATYRLALEEYSRDRFPLKWGMAQNNLGTALVELGGGTAGQCCWRRRSPPTAPHSEN